jgi:hypothetical protein
MIKRPLDSVFLQKVECMLLFLNFRPLWRPDSKKIKKLPKDGSVVVVTPTKYIFEEELEAYQALLQRLD